jgi:hypothetical protein
MVLLALALGASRAFRERRDVLERRARLGFERPNVEALERLDPTSLLCQHTARIAILLVEPQERLG